MKYHTSFLDQRSASLKLRLQIACIFGCTIVTANQFGFAYADTCSDSAPGVLSCTGSLTVYDRDFNGYTDVYIDLTGNWAISGPQGVGYYMNNTTRTINANLDVKTNGTASDALRTNGGYNVIFNKNVNIQAKGSSADGVNLTVSSSGQMTFNGDVSVSVLGTNGGVGVRSNRNSRGLVNRALFNGDLTVYTEGKGSNLFDSTGYGIYAGSRYYESAGTSGGAEVIVKGKTTVTTIGKDAYAVYANNEGIIELSTLNVTTTGQKAHGLVSDIGGVTGKNYAGGKIYLTGDTSVTVATSQGSYAMFSSGDQSLIASQKADGTKMPAIYSVTGDLVAQKTGTIDLEMTDGSSFIGITDKEKTGNTATELGTINLKINGASSLWQLTGSSNLTTLDLNTSANVSFSTAALLSDGTNKVTLTTDTLTGNGGVFKMRTDMANEVGDLIQVTTKSSGTHRIDFVDNRSGGYTGNEKLMVVEFTGANPSTNANNAAIFNSSGADVGAYIYGLSKDSSDGNWYLSRGASPSPNPPLNNTANNAASFIGINYYLGFIENQTLLQRMGELRKAPEKDGEIWMRTFGGGLDHFADKRLSSFDMTYYGVQVGIDKHIDCIENGDLFLGLMAGMIDANVDFNVGDGAAKQYHFGAYATYKANNGFYIDAIAKYLHARDSFDTETTGGYAVTGKGNMDGYSLGVEIGQRLYKDSNKQGWYAEPQAQLTWSHMGGATIRASNGLKTRLGDYDSLLGRASVIIGYSLTNNQNPIDIYFKTGYLHEFNGDTDYTFNNTFREKYSFGSGWWDNGIGFNVQFDGHKNLYLDANYAAGDRFNNWQLNTGYRHQF